MVIPRPVEHFRDLGLRVLFPSRSFEGIVFCYDNHATFKVLQPKSLPPGAKRQGQKDGCWLVELILTLFGYPDIRTATHLVRV